MERAAQNSKDFKEPWKQSTTTDEARAQALKKTILFQHREYQSEENFLWIITRQDGKLVYQGKIVKDFRGHLEDHVTWPHRERPDMARVRIFITWPRMDTHTDASVRPPVRRARRKAEPEERGNTTAASDS